MFGADSAITLEAMTHAEAPWRQARGNVARYAVRCENQPERHEEILSFSVEMIKRIEPPVRGAIKKTEVNDQRLRFSFSYFTHDEQLSPTSFAESYCRNCWNA